MYQRSSRIKSRISNRQNTVAKESCLNELLAWVMEVLQQIQSHSCSGDSESVCFCMCSIVYAQCEQSGQRMYHTKLWLWNIQQIKVLFEAYTASLSPLPCFISFWKTLCRPCRGGFAGEPLKRVKACCDLTDRLWELGCHHYYINHVNRIHLTSPAAKVGVVE